MPVLLILLVAAFVELTVLVVVGNAIGVLATVGLLILASLVGAAAPRGHPHPGRVQRGAAHAPPAAP
jgi:UPF0716 family protein affecting phage T7 exclusion